MTGLLSLVLVACMGRAVEAPDPLEEALADVEDRFRDRAELPRLDEGLELGWSLLADWPEDPRVLGALSWGYAARGYGHPGPTSEADYRLAYELARRCLDRNAGWTSRQQAAGLRVTREAVDRLVVDDLPCLEPGLRALVRWIELRGPAAWVDLRDAHLLASRALELSVDGSGWVPPWALAMVLALDPVADSTALDEAAGLFREAEQRQPELATPTVDRLFRVARASADTATLKRAANAVRNRFSPVPVDHPWALENRRGLHRLDTLTP